MGNERAAAPDPTTCGEAAVMPERCGPSGLSIRLGMVVVGAAFFLQGFAVYTDFPRNRPRPRLSGGARAGVDLWRRHNCQACHQLHGFGGFLGPDLTNVVSRRPRPELVEVLVRGRRQMPAFGLEPEDCNRILEFLGAMDDSGRSQPPAPGPRDGLAFDFLQAGAGRVPGLAGDPRARHGEELFRRNGCGACHRPFSTGRDGAPDLTLATDRAKDPDIARLIRSGSDWMPAYEALDDEQVGDILAYLHWTNRHRRHLGLRSLTPRSVGTLPWFEY